MSHEPYTKKPKGPPTLDMASIVKRLQLSQALTAKQAQQLIEWKQYVEASDNWNGVEGGGLHDVLKALCLGVDGLKVHLDALSQSVVELRADVEALKEAPPATPFP